MMRPFADVCFRTQPGAPYTTLREIAFPDWREVRSSLRTTNFLSAVTTLSSSRLIMVLPKKTADTLANAGLVAIVETKSLAPKKGGRSAPTAWRGPDLCDGAR